MDKERKMKGGRQGRGVDDGGGGDYENDNGRVEGGG